MKFRQIVMAIQAAGMALTTVLWLQLGFHLAFPDPQPQDLIPPMLAPNPAPWAWPAGFKDPCDYLQWSDYIPNDPEEKAPPSEASNTPAVLPAAP